METKTTIYIASDHGGFELKNKLVQDLTGQGYQCEDLGPAEFDKTDDYPQYAKLVAEKVLENADSRGILVCRTGVGVSMVANKHKGIRSALAISAAQIKKARGDEDLNVLALAGDYIAEDDVADVLDAFLNTEFTGTERHVRRLGEIEEIENTNFK